MFAEEQNLIQTISQENSLSSRLIYADWLEEHGDARCEFLRAQVQWAIKLSNVSDTSTPLVERLKTYLTDIDQKHSRNWLNQIELKFDVEFNNLGAMSFPLMLWLKRNQGYSAKQIDEIDAKRTPLQLGLKLGAANAIHVWNELCEIKRTSEPYSTPNDILSSEFQLYLLDGFQQI